MTADAPTKADFDLDEELQQAKEADLWCGLAWRIGERRKAIDAHYDFEGLERVAIEECARLAEELAWEIRAALAAQDAPPAGPEADAAADCSHAAADQCPETTVIERVEAEMPAPRKWSWIPLIGWLRSKAA